MPEDLIDPVPLPPPGETWKDIPGYEGYYQVSDRGRVQSLPRTVTRDGRPYRRLPGRALRPQSQNSGHLHVSLCKGGRKLCRVHRLVLEAFVGPCPPGGECLHRNGNPADNRLENLRWGTHRENQDDMARHGTSCQGERQWQARLTGDDVLQIRRLRGQGLTLAMLGRLFGVHADHVGQIIRRGRWKHI